MLIRHKQSLSRHSYHVRESLYGGIKFPSAHGCHPVTATSPYFSRKVLDLHLVTYWIYTFKRNWIVLSYTTEIFLFCACKNYFTIVGTKHSTITTCMFILAQFQWAQSVIGQLQGTNSMLYGKVEDRWQFGRGCWGASLASKCAIVRHPSTDSSLQIGPRFWVSCELLKGPEIHWWVSHSTYTI